MKHWSKKSLVVLALASMNSLFVACVPDTKVNNLSQLNQASDVTRFNDVQVDPRKKVMTSTFRVLDQSNQIFVETWSVLFGRGVSVPQSVFKAVSNRLKFHQSGAGDIIPSAGQCPNTFVRLESNDYVTDKRVSFFKLSQILCDGTKELEKVEMAKIDFLGNGVMRMKIQPIFFKEGVGDSLSILNQAILCDANFDIQDRLQSLNCSGLGQNRERMLHVKFQQLFYNRRAGDMLVATADHFLNLTERVHCDDTKKPCLSLSVPMNGRIQIVDNQVMKAEAEKKVTDSAASPEQLKLLKIVSNLPVIAATPAETGEHQVGNENYGDQKENFNEKENKQENNKEESIKKDNGEESFKAEEAKGESQILDQERHQEGKEPQVDQQEQDREQAR